MGLTACDKKENDRSVKGADYNQVMNQGLKQEGIPLQNDGFYIYNKKIDNITQKISKDAKLLIIMGSEQKPTDKVGFAKRIKEYQTPYVITIQSDTIVKIVEQYVP